MANDFNLNGAKITITNVSKSINFSYDDKGTISPTNKISNKINTDEIVQPVEIEIPSWISYRNMTINPGETISFETNKIKEIMYYLELSKNPIEGIKIDISAIEGSTSEPILIEKTITENNTYSAADDNADGYSTVTVNVSATTPIPGTRSGAVIRDYDGSVIASYTPAQFAALTAYPAQPVHTGLTGQGYNWSLANAKAYVAKYGYVEVGATYITDDGKTRFYIYIASDEYYDKETTISLGLNGTAVIDWGDGSETDTITGEDINSSISTSHTYKAVNKYIVTIDIIDGNASFMGNDFELVKVEIGSRITSIGDNALSSNNLTSITIPEGVTEISYGAFSQSNLTSITIPKGVTEIGNDAFKECRALTSITIPEGITEIGEYTFEGCYTLSSITIPEGVTKIGRNVFGSCSVLASIIIPEGITEIGESAFSGSALTSITIPERVTEISYGAFSSCPVLTSITIPEGVTKIGNGAFKECRALTSITIPEGVTEIGETAFDNALTSITFESTTPPTIVSNLGINPFCTIYVPTGTIEAYTTAENYPDPTIYTYIEY